jgi:2-dehydropantoate 2-reductase
MRFIVYGAGAIGGTVGGHLALGEYDVLLVARPGHVKAIRQCGFRFVTPGGTHTLRLPAVTGAAEIEFQEDDVVLLCVKSQGTEAALRELSSAVADVPIFCFQNGVRNEEVAARSFDRVYGVMVRIGGTYLRDGEVIGRRDPPGAAVIGRFPEGLDPLAESVAAALRAVDFAVLVVPDVMRYKWGKLMANLGNAVGAITNARDEDTERVAGAARTEARAILVQAGVDWLPHDRLREEWPGLERPLRGRVDIQAYSSTWQSLMRGVGTAESEYLNGEIVRLGEQVGMETPINSALTRIVVDMAEQKEPPGRYTPAELCALLDLAGDGGGE